MTAAAGVAKIHETKQRRIFEVNSLLCCDLAQRGINVRKMVGGNVADEGAIDFVVAHAAMQPAEEDDELYAGGSERGQDGVPMDRHVGPVNVLVRVACFERLSEKSKAKACVAAAEG